MKTAVRFTCDQYLEMARLGLFEPREEHHVELIFGRIVGKFGKSTMSPAKPPHANGVRELTAWSYEDLPRGAAFVWVQTNIVIPLNDSMPEPDIAWITPDDYSDRLPTADDILLLIEVSDTTLKKDQGRKVKLYAKAGIRDYWLVNIQDRGIEVRRNPVGLTYKDVTIYLPGLEVHPLAFPDLALPVSRLFPG